MTEIPVDSEALAAGRPAVAPPRFRTLMATFPTGVAIVTAAGPDGRPWGMTCSSVCGVAVDPATLLVCLREGSPTLEAVLRLGTFAVNLLHEAARPVAELFASGSPDRFDRVPWEAGSRSGVPHLFSDAHTIADCRVSRTTRVGDHTVVFGEVFGVRELAGTVPKPLLYGLRGYGTWSRATPVERRGLPVSPAG